MVTTDLKQFIKIITAAVVVFAFIGCGGGQQDLSATGSNPAPTQPDNPAPNDPQPTPPSGGSGTASLSWTPPTTYEDGSFMTVSGHHIYMDDGNGLVKIGTITNPSISDYVVQNLASGTYTFLVTAYDSQGLESTFSNSASISI